MSSERFVFPFEAALPCYQQRGDYRSDSPRTLLCKVLIRVFFFEPQIISVAAALPLAWRQPAGLESFRCCWMLRLGSPHPFLDVGLGYSTRELSLRPQRGPLLSFYFFILIFSPKSLLLLFYFPICSTPRCFPPPKFCIQVSSAAQLDVILRDDGYATTFPEESDLKNQREHQIRLSAARGGGARVLPARFSFRERHRNHSGKHYDRDI